MNEDIQPETVEIRTVDGIFVKTMRLKYAGLVVPQHAHCYDHLSLLARGSIQAWKDDEYLGEFNAPCGIEIKAGCKHKFLSLEPETLILCIHNIERAGEVEISEYHELEDETCLGAR